MRLVFAILLVARVAAADQAPAAVGVSLGVTAAGLGFEFVAADVGIRPQAYPDNTPALQPILATVGGALLLVGPSLGRAIYAPHSLWNKWLAMRLVGIGIAGIGVATTVILADQGSSGWIPGIIGGAIVIAGAGLYIGGATVEIVTTPAAVRREGATVSIAPIRGPGGSLAPGLVVAGRF
jgi:hypothetical protein